MVAKGRIVRISLGLVAAGAVVGAVSGALGVAAALVFRYGVHALLSVGVLRVLGVLAFGATVGAIIGLVTGPIAAWAFLRRVPIGRMLLWTALGTVAGAVVGEWIWPLHPFEWTVPGILRGGFLGFALASVGLRLTDRRHRDLEAPV